MLDSPLVSIIVPSFNQAQYLPAALDSVMFQDYPNLEIVICNHGSTDQTSEVIKYFVQEAKTSEVSFLKHYDANAGENHFVRHYEKRYPPGRKIIVRQSEENIGGTASYNEGFRAASGTYCTYLVGDDYFYPTAISEMVEALDSNEADFVYADMFVVNDHGRILQHLRKPDYSFAACFADWFHLGVCKLYRRELHQKVGYYDPEYRNANDYDMYLRFAMAGYRFTHLPSPLYCVRKHDPNSPDEPASWRNEGYRNLMRESILCAERARDFQGNQEPIK